MNDDLSPLPGTEVHYLRSEHVGDEFKVIIGHCHAPDRAAASVLFLGDTWANFGTAVEIIRLMRLSEVVPPLLVVGVGYRTTALDRLVALRARDFTPSVAFSPGFDDAAMMGGADSFIAFVQDELKPWLRARFPVDPDDSMSFGDSLGGLFATYVLLSTPKTFLRYGIGSPSLWWDAGSMFAHEEQYAHAHDDLDARAFFSVGAHETLAGRRRFIDQLPADRRARAEAEDAADPPVDMVADCERMVAALRGRAYRRLDVGLDVLPGEYHETAPPVNLSRSLRYLFDAPH
ncbi:MAG TPA: alpha/beta hydrolase-fold protein [Gaiellales bacterium]